MAPTISQDLAVRGRARAAEPPRVVESADRVDTRAAIPLAMFAISHNGMLPGQRYD
jgi:hypothetical protein